MTVFPDGDCDMPANVEGPIQSVKLPVVKYRRTLDAMKSTMQLMVAAISLLVAGCKVASELRPIPATTLPSVSVDELNDHVPVIGRLGKPLGEIVIISGRVVRPGERNDYWSENMAHNLFAVETVEKHPLKTDIEIYLPRDVELPKGGTVRLVGYEDGGFINPPSMAGKYDPELWMMQSTGRHFHTEFYALKILP
jgi:hypothetical protein